MKFECKECSFIYDELLGIPEEGINPGTKWNEMPDNWISPNCGVSKAKFISLQVHNEN